MELTRARTTAPKAKATGHGRKGQWVAYVRVGSGDQNTARQLGTRASALHPQDERPHAIGLLPMPPVKFTALGKHFAQDGL